MVCHESEEVEGKYKSGYGSTKYQNFKLEMAQEIRYEKAQTTEQVCVGIIVYAYTVLSHNGLTWLKDLNVNFKVYIFLRKNIDYLYTVGMGKKSNKVQQYKT